MRYLAVLFLLTGCTTWPQDTDHFDLSITAQAGDCIVVVDGVRALQRVPEDDGPVDIVDSLRKVPSP